MLSACWQDMEASRFLSLPGACCNRDMLARLQLPTASSHTLIVLGYKRRPRRPPFRLVESVGIGVTSSTTHQEAVNSSSISMKLWWHVDIEPKARSASPQSCQWLDKVMAECSRACFLDRQTAFMRLQKYKNKVPRLTNSPNFDTSSRQSAQSRLCAWPRGLGLVSTCSPQLDMHSTNSKLLQTPKNFRTGVCARYAPAARARVCKQAVR